MTEKEVEALIEKSQALLGLTLRAERGIKMLKKFISEVEYLRNEIYHLVHKKEIKQQAEGD